MYTNSLSKENIEYLAKNKQYVTRRFLYLMDPGEIGLDGSEFSFMAWPEVIDSQGNSVESDIVSCYQYLRDVFKYFPYEIEIGASEQTHYVTCTEDQYKDALLKVIERLEGFINWDDI